MKSLVRILGLLLVIGGIAGAIYFYAYFDPSVVVPERKIFGQTVGGQRVINIGLMAERQNGMLFGFGALAIGIVLAYVGRETESADDKKCPFCAERVKREAKVCKHCRKDLPEEVA